MSSSPEDVAAERDELARIVRVFLWASPVRPPEFGRKVVEWMEKQGLVDVEIPAGYDGPATVPGAVVRDPVDVEKLTVSIMGSELVTLYGIASVDVARYHATRIAKVYRELAKAPLPADVAAAAAGSPSLPRRERG